MIYSKTEAGVNAIKNRSSGLSPRQRSVLIMCDGKRDSGEILKATAGLGVTANDLETLVSLQMLTSSGPAAAQAAAPASPAALGSNTASVADQALEAAPEASRKVSSDELKVLIRRATKELEKLLGPSCEPLSLKLEKTKNYDEFAIQIYDVRRVLMATRSEKIANEFVASALA